MQVRHFPNRDHRKFGVTTLKYASAHVPGFLTGSIPPKSHRQLLSKIESNTVRFYRTQAGSSPR